MLHRRRVGRQLSNHPGAQPGHRRGARDTAPRLGAEETRRAIDAAERAWPAWRAKTAKERSVILLPLSTDTRDAMMRQFRSATGRSWTVQIARSSIPTSNGERAAFLVAGHDVRAHRLADRLGAAAGFRHHLAARPRAHRMGRRSARDAPNVRQPMRSHRTSRRRSAGCNSVIAVRACEPTHSRNPRAVRRSPAACSSRLANNWEARRCVNSGALPAACGPSRSHEPSCLECLAYLPKLCRAQSKGEITEKSTDSFVAICINVGKLKRSFQVLIAQD